MPPAQVLARPLWDRQGADAETQIKATNCKRVLMALSESLRSPQGLLSPRPSAHTVVTSDGSHPPAVSHLTLLSLCSFPSSPGHGCPGVAVPTRLPRRPGHRAPPADGEGRGQGQAGCTGVASGCANWGHSSVLQGGQSPGGAVTVGRVRPRTFLGTDQPSQEHPWLLPLTGASHVVLVSPYSEDQGFVNHWGALEPLLALLPTMMG